MDEDLRGFRNLAGLGAEPAETMIKACGAGARIVGQNEPERADDLRSNFNLLEPDHLLEILRWWKNVAKR